MIKTLVSTDKILKKAKIENSAVLSPNVFSLEMVNAAIEAANEEKSPIILAYDENLQKYADIYEFAEVAKIAAQKFNIPVSLHLDHGKTFKGCMRAIHANFSSIMVDRFSPSYEDNVKEIKELAKIAHSLDVSVEAELGRIDPDGKYNDKGLVDPNLAIRFVNETNIDALAVVIVHGLYEESKAEIDFEKLKVIKEKVDIPLVLHGGSAAGDKQLQRACSLGINKVNIGYELDIAAVESLTSGLENLIDDYEFPQRIFAACKRYKENIKHYIRMVNNR